MQRLVLKGGNALTLIYKLSSRASLDLDFSIENDFEDIDATRQRIFRTLKDRFDSAGYVVFDERLDAKPKLSGPDERPWWGGYELKFKLIEKKKHSAMLHKPDKMRIDSLIVGPSQQRVFTVDLSKYEYTDGKIELDLDDYTIYVYTPAMVAIEKLRAICQQMPEYEVKGQGRPRARDFFDIHLVLSKEGIDLTASENLDLIQSIFAAKKSAATANFKNSRPTQLSRPRLAVRCG
jgi:hypothetical protein